MEDSNTFLVRIKESLGVVVPCSKWSYCGLSIIDVNHKKNLSGESICVFLFFCKCQMNSYIRSSMMWASWACYTLPRNHSIRNFLNSPIFVHFSFLIALPCGMVCFPSVQQAKYKVIVRSWCCSYFKYFIFYLWHSVLRITCVKLLTCVDLIDGSFWSSFFLFLWVTSFSPWILP